MKKRYLCVLVTLTLLLCTLLPSCTPPTELQKFTANSFDYFDTVTVITGYETDRETFDAVAQSIFDSLAEYHTLYTVYHRFDGLENLCTINELTDGAHRTVTVDRRILEMLTFAKEVYHTTDGLVNVAMGSVLSLWHDYRTIGMDNPAAASLPPTDQLRLAADHTAIDDVVIDEENATVTLRDPLMTLDVGAVAKGYAVERIAKELEARGIEGYVLNVGGNVRTVGSKPNGEPWTIGIEDPSDPQGGYLAYMALNGQALVTSGSYQRYYTVDGKRYHHIIHPDTLMPAEGYLSVSVICDDSGLADALSTALFCMSPEDGLALVESLTDVQALWVKEDRTQLTSSGWSAFVKQ